MPSPLLSLLLKPRPHRHFARYERVLGTALELHLQADTQAVAAEAEARVLLELDRLEGLYSRFLPNSELNRWQEGKTQSVSAELSWLLLEAERWQKRTGGAFNPAVEAVQALYRQHPEPAERQLEALRAALQAPLWTWEGFQPFKLTPLSLNFNALAKGRIADLAGAAALKVRGIQAVSLNLGGDLCHRGAGDLRVAVTDPFSGAENVPSLTRIRVQNQGVATSGHTQRGQHLFDPRTARPVTGAVQATVVAPDAATADVLATAFCVLRADESLALAEHLGVACLIVDFAGETHRNPLFASLEASL